MPCNCQLRCTVLARTSLDPRGTKCQFPLKPCQMPVTPFGKHEGTETIETVRIKVNQTLDTRTIAKIKHFLDVILNNTLIKYTAVI